MLCKNTIGFYFENVAPERITFCTPLKTNQVDFYETISLPTQTATTQ
jgi:hypothetical protein